MFMTYIKCKPHSFLLRTEGGKIAVTLRAAQCRTVISIKVAMANLKRFITFQAFQCSHILLNVSIGSEKSFSKFCQANTIECARENIGSVENLLFLSY